MQLQYLLVVIVVSDISVVKDMSSTVIAAIFAITWVVNNYNIWTEPRVLKRTEQNLFQTKSDFCQKTEPKQKNLFRTSLHREQWKSFGIRSTVNGFTGRARRSWRGSCPCVQSAGRCRTSSLRQSSRRERCGRSHENLPRRRPVHRSRTLLCTQDPAVAQQHNITTMYIKLKTDSDTHISKNISIRRS